MRNHASHVNISRALAEFGCYPGHQTDRKVFTLLAQHANPQGETTISHGMMSRMLGKNKSTIYASVHRMRQKGFLDFQDDPLDSGRCPRKKYVIAPRFLEHQSTATSEQEPVVKTLHRDLTLHDVLVDVVAHSCSRRNQGEHEMTEETLAKFTAKLTELHHDLLGLLNGFDVVWMELGDLEGMADKNLGTHLNEYADQVGAGMTDEEWKAYNAKFEPTKEEESE